MALFSERASMLEVQNRALIKSAGERTQRISKLECELDVLKAEAERLKAEVAQREAEVAQLKLEREFYCKRALAFEQHNHKLTETPPNTPYGVRSWNANSLGLIPMVPLGAGSERTTKHSLIRADWPKLL